MVGINGTELKLRCPPGAGDGSLTNPKLGKNCALQQVFPATLLQAGTNTITVQTDVGSWVLYDDVRLESGVAPPAEPLRLQAEAMPWLKRADGGVQRQVRVWIENLIGPERARDRRLEGWRQSRRAEAGAALRTQ